MNVDWMVKAACKGQPADAFFPDDEETARYTQARRICLSCPVRDECLAFALKLNIGHGMFAGLTPASAPPFADAFATRQPDDGRGAEVACQATHFDYMIEIRRGG